MASMKHIDLWQTVAADLNNTILTSGEIQINNHHIWNTYLHKWDNEDWKGILAAVCELQASYSQYVDVNGERALRKTIETILRWENHHERCLDTKKHKKTAWRMLMTLREIWNAANGIDLPNSNKSRVKTNFHTLFEDDDTCQ